MPARPAATPRGGPAGGQRVAVLVSLPQGEVARVPLAAHLGVGFGHVVQALVRQRTVLWPGPGVEVHVAAAVFRRVGMAGIDESADQFDHFGDVAGGTGLIGRGQHADPVVGGSEHLLVLIGVSKPRAALFDGLLQDLVVDVGHIAHQQNIKSPVGQPAAKLVEHDRRAHVADVGRALNGRTAHVDPHLAVTDGNEGFEGAGLGVIQLNCHG